MDVSRNLPFYAIVSNTSKYTSKIPCNVRYYQSVAGEKKSYNKNNNLYLRDNLGVTVIKALVLSVHFFSLEPKTTI